MGKYVLEGWESILETNIVDKVFIPKLFLMSFDTMIHFKFQRRQFLSVVSFVMTINKKNQGQSLKHGGIYLPTFVFSHSQLYVEVLRVTSKKGLKILITN